MTCLQPCTQADICLLSVLQKPDGGKKEGGKKVSSKKRAREEVSDGETEYSPVHSDVTESDSDGKVRQPPKLQAHPCPCQTSCSPSTATAGLGVFHPYQPLVAASTAPCTALALDPTAQSSETPRSCCTHCHSPQAALAAYTPSVTTRAALLSIAQQTKPLCLGACGRRRLLTQPPAAKPQTLSQSVLIRTDTVVSPWFLVFLQGLKRRRTRTPAYLKDEYVMPISDPAERCSPDPVRK